MHESARAQTQRGGKYTICIFYLKGQKQCYCLYSGWNDVSHSVTASHTHTHGVTISYSNFDKLSPKWELHFTVHVPATSRLHPILDSLICSLFTFFFSFSGKRFAWVFVISAAFLACKWNWKFSYVWNVEQESKGKKTYRKAITLAFLSVSPNLKIWRSGVARDGVCT